MHLKETADVVWFMVYEMQKRYMQNVERPFLQHRLFKPVGQAPQRTEIVLSLLSNGTHG